MIYGALFALGLLGSWFATKGYLAVQSKQPIRAALYDLGAIEAGIISLQVWATILNYSFAALQSEAVGLACGTWIAVRWF